MDMMLTVWWSVSFGCGLTRCMLRYAGHGIALMMAETETRQYQNAWGPSAYAATTEECWLDLPTMAILEKGGVYLFGVM